MFEDEAVTPQNTLPFLVSILDDEDDRSGGTKAIFDRRSSEPVLRQIPVAAIRDNLRQTVEDLRALFRDIAATEDVIALRQIELSFEVSASGKIALLGASTEATGKGAITLTFGNNG